MRFVIVTGISGAGKSKTIEALEDIGFYCVDNVPPTLITKFADIFLNNETNIDKLAIVTDIRGGEMFGSLTSVLSQLENNNIQFEVLFLDAEDSVLIKRFKETRRKHPLIEEVNGSVEIAIKRERELLEKIKSRADYIVDTTHISPAQLKEQITGLFLENSNAPILVNCMSFGFKYGIPQDADLVFDVRCLPNPFYIPELKHKTGLDAEVREYVMQFENSKIFFEKIKDMVGFSLPLYLDEGKSQLVIAIGCTGGKHRSATFAELLTDVLQKLGYDVRVNHRDIKK